MYTYILVLKLDRKMHSFWGEPPLTAALAMATLYGIMV
jgi:hypothetical protein